MIANRYSQKRQKDKLYVTSLKISWRTSDEIYLLQKIQEIQTFRFLESEVERGSLKEVRIK